MTRYFVKRLAGAIPTLFVIITAAFFLIRAAPGGPFDQEQRLPPEILANLESAYGLDLPIWTQYGRYIKALAHGEAASPGTLAALNAAITAGHHGRSLLQTGTGFAWNYPAPDSAPDGLLAPIARSAADVLLTEPLDRLKQCPGVGCGWLFLDRSKNSIRVWCEMEVCGPRAKARARAERRRTT